MEDWPSSALVVSSCCQSLACTSALHSGWRGSCSPRPSCPSMGMAFKLVESKRLRDVSLGAGRRAASSLWWWSLIAGSVWWMVLGTLPLAAALLRARWEFRFVTFGHITQDLGAVPLPKLVAPALAPARAPLNALPAGAPGPAAGSSSAWRWWKPLAPEARGPCAQLRLGATPTSPRSSPASPTRPADAGVHQLSRPSTVGMVPVRGPEPTSSTYVLALARQQLEGKPQQERHSLAAPPRACPCSRSRTCWSSCCRGAVSSLQAGHLGAMPRLSQPIPLARGCSAPSLAPADGGSSSSQELGKAIHHRHPEDP